MAEKNPKGREKVEGPKNKQYVNMSNVQNLVDISLY